MQGSHEMQLHPQHPALDLPLDMFELQHVVPLTMAGDWAQRFHRAMKGQKMKAAMKSRVETSADRKLLFWSVGERRRASSGKR